jgi:hypothetical protein
MKKIKYKLMTEVKNTYLDIDGKEAEEVTQIFSDVEIQCTEANFAANYAIAEKEAYNGEITVEDDGQPEPVKPETDEPTFDDMAEAIKEGVNEV